MRKTKMLFGAVLALCLLAFSAQAASAQTINGPSPFNASNTGPAAGAHVFSVGGVLVVRCNNMDLTTPPAFTGTHNGVRAIFRPRYTNCTANIGGVPFPATVTISCDWTLTPLTFNAATGAGTGRLAIGDGVNDNPDANATCAGASAVKVDIGANCDVFVFEQTLNPGPGNGTVPEQNGTLASQNLTSANTNSPANGPAANLLVTANVDEIDGRTVGCPAGVPTTFTNATYTGNMYVPGIYLS